jgi:hypothetical protein
MDIATSEGKSISTHHPSLPHLARRTPYGYFGVRLDNKTPMELWLPPQESFISKVRREHVVGAGLASRFRRELRGGGLTCNGARNGVSGPAGRHTDGTPRTPTVTEAPRGSAGVLGTDGVVL